MLPDFSLLIQYVRTIAARKLRFFYASSFYCIWTHLVYIFQMIPYIVILAKVKFPWKTAPPKKKKKHALPARQIAQQVYWHVLRVTSRKLSTTKGVQRKAMTVISAKVTRHRVLHPRHSGPSALLISVVLETSAMVDHHLTVGAYLVTPVLCT